MEPSALTVDGFGGVVVRGQRSTVWIAAAVAMMSLLMAALAQRHEFGIAGRSDWLAALRLAGTCAGAVGVIVLGVGWAGSPGWSRP